MTLLTDLRALALAATPGPFDVEEMGNEDEGITRTVNTFAASRWREVAIITTGDFADDQEARNADYIAACSPERVIALLDVIEAAKVIDKVGSLANARERAYLRAALAELERSGE